MKHKVYPFKFTPILKEKVWGGNKLKDLFSKEFDGAIGESWEISGVEDNVSEVMNGSVKGKSLNELIDLFKEDFLGKKVYHHFGNKFPLLFKFIDAKEDLSVQLHPDDTLAQSRHNSFGKTEMWYIMEADKEARLILGFNSNVNEEIYLKHLSENKITDILHSEPVEKGDSFFIAPGTVHAIGAGVVLAEIQQTSDITYRIYDWDRPGIDGEFRELHTEEALDVIDYGESKAKLEFSEKKNQPFQICKSPYFETNKIIATQSLQIDITEIDSFVVYMCVEGKATIKAGGFSEHIKTGETILIPAQFNTVELITSSASFLEVYIP